MVMETDLSEHIEKPGPVWSSLHRIWSLAPVVLTRHLYSQTSSISRRFKDLIAPPKRERGRSPCVTRPISGLDDLIANRVANKLRDGVHVESAHNIHAMRVHGFNADAQLQGDLFVRPPFGDELNHLTFARRETML